MDTDLASTEGSTDADFNAFVRARTPSLLRAAYLLTGDQHLAEDLVQTALARTHLAWRRLHDIGNADAYARKIMYHAQISVWRRRRPVESLPGTLPEPGTNDPTAVVAMQLSVRAALAKLTPKQRSLLVLRYLEDRSEAETAELLGIAIGTVKSETHRALQRMRDLGTGLLTEDATVAAAEGVRLLDLEPGIARTTRTLVRRRRAVAVGVTALALAVLFGIVSAVRPPAGPPPANPSLTTTLSPSTTPSSSTTLSPTPNPSGPPPGTLAAPSGPVPAFGCPGVGSGARGATSLAVRLTFWRVDEARNCLILSTLDRGQLRDFAAVRLGTGYGPRNTVTLSPDGTQVAWVANEDSMSIAGDLVVAKVGGSSARLLAGGVQFDGGAGPRWELDSRHLVVYNRDSVVRVDSLTGTTSAGVIPGTYVTYSPSGTYQTYGVGTVIVVARPDGTVVHRFSYDGPHTGCDCGFSTQAVSDDGRFVAVGYRNTDATRVVGGTVVVDATTGQEVTLPVNPPAGTRVLQIVFRPGGGALVLTGNWDGAVARAYLLSSSFAVTSQTPVPELTRALLFSCGG